MDVIFDWNLGNMIYNGLITLRHCGFPFMEIEVASAAAAMLLRGVPKPVDPQERAVYRDLWVLVEATTIQQAESSTS